MSAAFKAQCRHVTGMGPFRGQRGNAVLSKPSLGLQQLKVTLCAGNDIGFQVC